jgi:hypothetical protein
MCMSKNVNNAHVKLYSSKMVEMSMHGRKVNNAIYSLYFWSKPKI